jgi:L-rhamnose isomerase/sugar isomerase
VDTGHHYQGQNIEQIVAWLLAADMLGGFHFNDRRYADDDLTMASVDPYQAFRIFHEIRFFEWERGATADMSFVVDQSHNLKGKIDAMIQTTTMAQSLIARAAIVDYETLVAAQRTSDLVGAEACLQDAFETDVRDVIREWRTARGLPEHPLEAFRSSGYLERITRERATRRGSSTPAASLGSSGHTRSGEDP